MTPTRIVEVIKMAVAEISVIPIGTGNPSVSEHVGQRVVTTIKIDDRRDKPLTMSGKVESVRKKLGR
jgi:uncharacterized protein YqgV (UPF0045/DUF77 family)